MGSRPFSHLFPVLLFSFLFFCILSPFVLYLLRRCELLIESGTRGALAFPRTVNSLLLEGVEYRNRFDIGEMTVHGLKVMAGAWKQRSDSLVAPIKTHAANERLAEFLENYVGEMFMFFCHPGTGATNWRSERGSVRRL